VEVDVDTDSDDPHTEGEADDDEEEEADEEEEDSQSRPTRESRAVRGEAGGGGDEATGGLGSGRGRAGGVEISHSFSPFSGEEESGGGVSVDDGQQAADARMTEQVHGDDVRGDKHGVSRGEGARGVGVGSRGGRQAGSRRRERERQESGSQELEEEEEMRRTGAHEKRTAIFFGLHSVESPTVGADLSPAIPGGVGEEGRELELLLHGYASWCPHQMGMCAYVYKFVCVYI